MKKNILILSIVCLLPSIASAQAANQWPFNADFSKGLTGWTTSIGQGCAGTRTATIIGVDSPFSQVLDLKSVGAGGCGGNTAIYQNLSLAVPQSNSLMLTANVKAISATVASGCGFEGQENPMNIQLSYTDPNSVQKQLIFTFFFGDGTCGNPTNLPADTTVVPTRVSQSTWFSFNSGNLSTWIPAGSRITRIYIFSSGWDYDGRADNVQLLDANPTASLTFARADYAVQSAPQGVTTADFNGDGVLDLAIANVFSNSISVLLGLGDGTFGPATNWGTLSEPSYLTTGDFNGDGAVDIVVSNHGPDYVTILLGHGDGNFGPANAIATGSDPVWVTTGDFNADGKLDVVVTNFASDSLSIFFGNGDGTLNFGAAYSTATGPTQVKVGDINGDTILDLAVASSTAGVVGLFLGNGDGTFRPRTDLSGGVNWGLELADLNGDGRLDIATTNVNSVAVRLGNGDGTFVLPLVFSAGTALNSVVAADLNGDGRLDLISSDQGGDAIAVLLGNGDGTFGAATGYATGSFPHDVTVGDFTGDFRLDLATGNRGSDTVSVLTQAPAVSLEPTSFDFGTVQIGSASAPKDFIITNTGSAVLQLYAVGADLGLDFPSFGGGGECAGAILPPGASCVASVSFAPLWRIGLTYGLLTVNSNAAPGVHTANLLGTGDEPPPSVTLLSPNGGEKLFSGTSFDIQWSASDEDDPQPNLVFDVEYSTNGGATFSAVSGCTGLSGLSGPVLHCTWSAPSPITTAGRIRVIAYDRFFNPGEDTSDANFSVVSGTGSITVTQPNTNLTWIVGATKQIKWNHNLGLNAYVMIELSRDAGANWELITPSFKNTGATSSVFNWAVTGPATTQGRVRVTWLNGPVSDISNVNFTIANPSVTVTQPNTNLNWGIGSTQQIKWNHNVGLGATFTIEVSRDGSLNYLETITTSAPATTATTGVYNWTVTGAATTQARVRVTYNANPIGTDTSNVNFIIANPFISVAAPSSVVNWGYGTMRTQTWGTNLGPGDLVNVLLSTDGGATFPYTLASGVVASLRTKNVTVPNLATPTTTARVRVEWVANTTVAGMNPVNFKVQPPFITVTQPNGPPSVWNFNTSRTILWTHNLGSLENARIELSLDGGATYTVVLFASTPCDGTQALTVQPAWATPQARVKIMWLKDGAINDASDNNFPIQP